MASKYEKIVSLADEHAREVIKDKEAWTSFLASSSMLCRYSFNEQLLIHPEAMEKIKEDLLQQAS